MTLESIREYCLSRPGKITEELPFDDVTLVYKIAGKMFALMSMTDVPLSVNLKCDPEHAMELRERYEAVQPGYHMSKKHWNTVIIDGSLSEKQICAMIDESYALVVATLPKALRGALSAKPGGTSRRAPTT